jgi:hypothetical protein
MAMKFESPSSLDEIYLKYVREALAHARNTGIRRKEIADALGIQPTSVSKLKHGRGVNKGRGLRAAEVAILSRVTKYPLPPNFPVALSNSMKDFIRLVQPAASGVWREASKMPVSAQLRIRPIEEPAYIDLDQYGRLIEDDHADDFASKGNYVICVDYTAANRPRNHGRIVGVESLRKAGNETLLEYTIRQFQYRGGRWYLASVSKSGDIFEPFPYEGDTEDMRIVDLVIGSYRPAPSV